MGKLTDYVTILNSQRIPVSSAERAKREKIYPYYGAQGIVDYIDDFIFDGEYILIAEDGENLRRLESKHSNLGGRKILGEQSRAHFRL